VSAPGPYRILGVASLAVFVAGAGVGLYQALSREGRPPPLTLVPRAAVRDLLERQDYARAARELEAMVRMNPDAWDLRALLGYVLSRLDRRDEAVAQYRAALDAVPDHRELRARLVVDLADSERFDEAIPHLRELLRLAPGDPDVHNSLGVALERSGDPEGALAHYESALRLDPAHRAAAENRARVRGEARSEAK